MGLFLEMVGAGLAGSVLTVAGICALATLDEKRRERVSLKRWQEQRARTHG